MTIHQWNLTVKHNHDIYQIDYIKMEKMLEIRRYQETDNQVVWELRHLALGPTGAFLRDDKWDEDLHDIQNRYLNNGGEFLLGVLDNKIVCMGAFRTKSDTLAEIKRMRVLPGYQRRGFGQIILHKLEEKALQLGYKEMCLDTTTRQIAAQKLYEKNGFIEVRRGKLAEFELIFYHKYIST
jgi:ribosomal protein S18 acetylase RimI-like enzyme